MENNQLSIKDIIDVFKKKKKKILLYSSFIAIITGGLSLLLPNYYTSEITFYINNSENLDPKFIFGEEVASFFAGEEDIERIKLISRSKEFQNQMISEYDLINYFDIDTSNIIKRSKVYEKLNDIITLTKDESQSIILEVEHKDPEIAAKMANSSAFILEKINSRVIYSFLQEQERLVSALVKENDQNLDNREKKIADIKKEHFIDVKSVGQNKETIAFAPSEDKYKEEFNNGIDKFMLNRENYMNSSESTVLIQNLLGQYKTIVESIKSKNIKTFTIVEEAYPNYIKDNPKRSLIVLFAFIISIFSFTYAFINSDKK
jgi:uncharacterized protein involved in exopolysaccharide biosynthesis